MQTCATCSAPLRAEAKFCTRCGSPVLLLVSEPTVASAPTKIAVAVAEPVAEPVIDPTSEPVAPTTSDGIPARIPPQRHQSRVLTRSAAATWALVTGVAPLVLSIAGNLIASQLGAAAVAQVIGGDAPGAWAPVLTVLALVFVGNAALLTVCAISGARGIRETANGVTRGRGLAVAGLALGGANLILWVAGLVVTFGGLNVVLA